MRASLLATLSFSVLALAACKPPPAKTAEPAASTGAPAASPSLEKPSLPQVKSGLWEMAIDVTGAPKGLGVKTCLDPAVQGQDAVIGEDYGRKHCSENSWRRTLDGGVDFHAVCDNQGMKIETKGQVRGDFSSKYSVTLDSVIERGGQSTNSRTVIDATRLGDCPAGMKPGDKQMTINGHTFTVGADGKPRM